MTVDMENQAAVGKLRGQKFRVKILKELVGCVWVQEVFVLPEVTTLSKG